MGASDFAVGDAGGAAYVVGDANAVDHHVHGDRAEDVDFVFQRCVGAAFGDAGHHRAGHGAVEEGAVPAAVDRAHRVAERKARGAAEHHAARLHAVERVAHAVADGRARQAAFDDALHELKAR